MFYFVCTLAGIIAGWFLIRAIDNYPDSTIARMLGTLERHIEQEKMLSVDNDFLVVTAASSAEEGGIRVTLRHSIEYDLATWNARDDGHEVVDRLYKAAMEDTSRQIAEDLESLKPDETNSES